MEAKPEPYQHKPTTTTTTTPAPHKKYQKREALPEPNPLQTYNDNYTNTLQKVPQEGGPPRAKPLQAYNHSYSYTSTLQNAPQEGGPTRTLQANQWKLLLPT